MKIHQWHRMIVRCWVLHPFAPCWAFHHGPASGTARSSFGPWWNKWWRLWGSMNQVGNARGDWIAKNAKLLLLQIWVKLVAMFVQCLVCYSNVPCCNNQWSNIAQTRQMYQRKVCWYIHLEYQPMVTIGQWSGLVVHSACLADIIRHPFLIGLEPSCKTPNQQNQLLIIDELMLGKKWMDQTDATTKHGQL